ncbi:hypothetical protein ACQEVF_42035 [Nonomuraea polychroma]|uniref:hypothetical protein n=1 Tax=Nonomuraea polychroma TaxID=46176 RepID=UPI003D8D0575
MSAEQVTGNKALFSRFHEAINSGAAEVIAKTIDELVAPDVLFHTPAPIDATGVQALKQVMFSRQLIFGWLLPTSMTQAPVFRRESK